MTYKQYLQIIFEMLQKMDGSDIIFLKQVYTIINRYENRKGQR